MAGGVSEAPARTAWPRRHPFWTLALVAVLALLLVAVLGGFREREHPVPRVAVATPVDLGQVDVTVRSAELVTTGADGKPLRDGVPRLLVHARVLPTDVKPGTVSASGDMQVRVDDRRTLKAATGWDAFRTYQPGVPADVTFPFLLDKGATAVDGVEINFRTKSYAWNNKIDVGPTWSGGRFTASVVLPVEGAS